MVANLISLSAGSQTYDVGSIGCSEMTSKR